MPKLWYGDDHDGNDTTALATDWISFTLGRPTARLAMNGLRPFVVKKVAWKVAAAPSAAHKMYARISNPDGSVYDNSYMGQTISWQKEAKVTYEFQAISLHFADDGGTKLRAWLISGGPFYFARKTGSGTIQTTGSRQFSGTPVGYVQWAQVALAPTGLKVARAADDPNKVTFAWTPWDVKKNLDECGDSTSLMGYCVQVARDAAFTQNVRLLYVSKGAGEAYGLYTGYDWYFRIATRNEVSEKYKLPGGQWSDAVKLAAQIQPVDVPSATAGLPAAGTGASTGTDAGSGGLSDNNPNAGSNLGGAAGTTTGTTTMDITEEVTNTTVKAAKDQIASMLTLLTEGATAAHGSPSGVAWNALAAHLASTSTLASTLQANAPVEVRGRWAAMVATIASVRNKVLTGAVTAAGVQSTNQKIDAGLASTLEAHDVLYKAVVSAKLLNSAAAWRIVGLRLDDLGYLANAMAGYTTGSTQSAWNAVKFKCAQASASTAAAVKKITPSTTELARSQAQEARQLTRDARAATSPVTTDYSVADEGVDNLVSDLQNLMDDTDEVTTVTRTVTIPGGTTIPTDLGGEAGSSGGSTPVLTQTESGTQVIFAPIPDTTALRSRIGGLLLSRSAKRPPGHTAYLMDRGGRARIAEIKDPSFIRYNRIRDDQSLASILLDGRSLKRNSDLIDKLAVGRHELLIYRGDERVWEGPITLAQFKRESIELRAHDITHYLNRTVIKNAYSNAYPNLDLVVNRIAGIIAAELAVKESLDPPINVLPYMRTYIVDGDARTSRTTLAAEMTLWQHLDDLAAKAGLDYTVIGRALHIWDTSRPAMGRIRKVTEADFEGDSYIAAYGMEIATQTFVSDGQGNYGRAGGIDDFYGEVDLLATAYDENGNAVNQEDNDPTNDTVPIAEMDEQAARNLKGRNPVPLSLKVPDGSSFRTDRGIGLDVLIPGVYIPVTATLAGRTLEQTMKLTEVRVAQDRDGETVSITVTPASDSDEANTLEDS